MKAQRRVILYMGVSVDGFIAGPDDDLSFLDTVQADGEDYGYADLTSNVDTLIMGRKTYDKLLSFGIPWPHPGKQVFVLSNTRTGSDENVSYYGGDLAHFIGRLRELPGRDIYFDAGGEVVQQALQRDLIDLMILSVVPYIVGSGKRLFLDGNPSLRLKLERTLTFPSGLVQLHYTRAAFQ